MPSDFQSGRSDAGGGAAAIGLALRPPRDADPRSRPIAMTTEEKSLVACPSLRFRQKKPIGISSTGVGSAYPHRNVTSRCHSARQKTSLRTTRVLIIVSCAKHICIEQEIVVRGTKWERRFWRLSSSHAVSFVMLVCLGHFYHATGAIEPVFAIADAAAVDVLPDIVLLSLVVFFASLNP